MDPFLLQYKMLLILESLTQQNKTQQPTLVIGTKCLMIQLLILFLLNTYILDY